MKINKKQKRLLISFFLNIFFIILCIVTLVPVLYTLKISLDANGSIIGTSLSFLPQNFTIEHYINIFTQKPILIWFKNTILLAVCTVILSLSVSIPAAFAFSRIKFKGRKTILNILILLNAFPAILSMFAIYKLMSPLNLINTKLGLILIYSGTMSIFGLWNLKGYFDTIPSEIEDAARIDGASELQVIKHILLPLAKPAVIVTSVMVMIYVWNEYIYAITFMTGAQNFTLAAGLYSLQVGEMTGSWPLFAAASIVVSLPVLIIFLKVQKHMISGLSAGGVKG